MPPEILRMFEDGFTIPYLAEPKRTKTIVKRLGVAQYLDAFKELDAEQGALLEDEEPQQGQQFVNKEYKHQVRVPYTLLEQ